MEVDRALTRDQVVLTRVGTDRVRVRRSSSPVRINLFLRPRRGTGRPLDLPGASSAGTETRDDEGAQCSRKGFAHITLPFHIAARMTTRRA